MKYIYGIGLFLFLSVSYAKIYKWIDDKGEVHFSDQTDNNISQPEVIDTIQNSPVNTDSSSHDFKPEKTSDSTLVSDMDELIEKVTEIKNDAESCEYNAINKKEIDVSCKNYYTVINRDFKPLINKVKDYIHTNNLSTSGKEVSDKLQEITNIATEADRKYSDAISILISELLNVKEKMRVQLNTCYSNSVMIEAIDASCQIYMNIYRDEYKPLSEKMKDYASDSDYIKNKVNEIDNDVNELNDKYTQTIRQLANTQKKY